jgi:hypothetical protein
MYTVPRESDKSLGTISQMYDWLVERKAGVDTW